MAKVVHSLGIVIENKLAGLGSKKTTDAKVQTKPSESKAKKPRDTKKVKKEAMRMTMEINEEPESKEIKKLKKSLIKKTDKVVKVAMKIEKKQQQEDKTRKTSLSSSTNSDINISLPAKKEKKEIKKSKKPKSKKSKDDLQVKTEETSEEETQYPITLVQSYPITPVQSYPVTPVKCYPITPVKDYPIVKSPISYVQNNEVVTKQPTSTNKSLNDEVFKPKAKKKPTVIDQLFARQMTGAVTPIEIKKDAGKLGNAVYLSDDNRLVQQVEPDAKVFSDVKMINMGCLEWTESFTVQKTSSCEGLICAESFLKLPELKPGEEGSLRFNFTAPSKAGLYESIWHFFDGKERFGPAIKFKFLVKADARAIPLRGVEMKDFGKIPEVEMKGIGISAKSQEMIEMSSAKPKAALSKNRDEDSVKPDSNHNLPVKQNDDVEVIPVPDCFNLDVPFEIVDGDKSVPTQEEKKNYKEDESPHDVNDKKSSKTSLEEAKEAIDLITEKIERSTTPLKIKIEPLPSAVERLVELGFANRDENRKLLTQNENNLEKVLDKLYDDRGSNWAENRH